MNSNHEDRNDVMNSELNSTPLLSPHVEIPSYGTVIASPHHYQNMAPQTPNDYQQMDIIQPAIINENYGTSLTPNSMLTDSDWSMSSDIKKEVAKAEVVRTSGFFRKVYIILTVQMLFTVMIAALCCKISWNDINLGQRMWDMVWPEVLSAIAAIAILVSLMFLSDKYPTNYILLGFYTLAWSIFVGCISGPVAGDGSVTAAFMIVSIVFIGLTILTFIERIRKKIWIFCLFALGFCIIGSIITYYLWFFAVIGQSSSGNRLSHIIYCSLFAGIFSCYMVIDSLAVRHNAKFNNYIYSCARLYADIVYMFVLLISLLGGGK